MKHLTHFLFCLPLLLCAACQESAPGGSSGDGAAGGAAGAASASCGNGVLDPGEACDGDHLSAGVTCASLGHEPGSLACDDACHIDTSGCGPATTEGSCGDHIVQSVRGEDCDGDNLAGADCQTFGLEEGSLTCNDSCQYDLSGCHHKADPCGNGKIDTGEACDGTNLDGKTCKSLGFASGTLTCSSDCKLDKTGCHTDPGTCGDGAITGTEVCDHDKLGGKTCHDLTYVNNHVQGGKTFHYTSGDLACRANCQSFDTSKCIEGYAGDPCTSGGQCPTLSGYVHLHNARCLTQSPNGVAFPGGYCTADCETGQMSYCCKLAAGVCVTLPSELGSGSICLKPCSGQQVCRDGYACKDVGGSSYCLPN